MPIALMPCQLTDRVIHKKCGKIRLIGELVYGEGHTFPLPQGAGQVVSSYRYCPCDSKNALVYDPGDGNLVLSNPDIVEVVNG